MVYKKLKFHNEPAFVYGQKFDSRKEARRYAELLILERAGQIKDLRRQVSYELIPAQCDDIQIGYYKRGALAGQPKFKTVCKERAVTYIADFVYLIEEEYTTFVNGAWATLKRWIEVVEDAKSEATRTPEYIIKRKLMRYLKGIEIREV